MNGRAAAIPGSRAGLLRVLFLATYFPKPGNPSMGTWALQQARALARQSIDLRVVSFTSWIPRFLGRSRGARAYAECPASHDWDGLTVEYPRWTAYPMQPFTRLTYRRPALQTVPGWWSARLFLGRLFREWRPDVVYAHHSLTNGSLAWRCRSAFGTPYVVTDHDLGEIADCGRFVSRWAAMATVARGASVMVSVSSRMEREVKRHFPFARTATLYNGTDPVPPAVLVTPRPTELGGRTVIFCAAMFYERKGIPFLIEAFARGKLGDGAAVLRIAGDGPARAEVEGTIRRLQLGDRVHLLGLLPHRQVLQEMAWADAFALLGWDEPFGVVFAEALAAGLPVVLASDAGAAELIQDGVQGLVVPPRDLAAASAALARVIEDRALRERLGTAGRSLWSSRLTWDSNASTLVGLLRSASREAPQDGRRTAS